MKSQTSKQQTEPEQTNKDEMERQRKQNISKSFNKSSSLQFSFSLLFNNNTHTFHKTTIFHSLSSIPQSTHTHTPPQQLSHSITTPFLYPTPQHTCPNNPFREDGCFHPSHIKGGSVILDLCVSFHNHKSQHTQHILVPIPNNTQDQSLMSHLILVQPLIGTVCRNQLHSSSFVQQPLQQEKHVSHSLLQLFPLCLSHPTLCDVLHNTTNGLMI